MIKMSDSELARSIKYRPVPFNFVDLEAKASDFMSKVKFDANQIASEARDEVARLRAAAFAEIEQTRERARIEAESIRSHLDDLNKKLQEEESNFEKRKAQLEAETKALREQARLEEETAKKTGYEDGYNIGYSEGTAKGYADGELQATVDYAERVRNEASIQLGVQLETLMPALKIMIDRLETARQSFLQLWEQSAIHFAVLIANRAISRELPNMIDVPLRLIRESLELGTGSTSIKIRINPDDYESLKPQIDLLVDELSVAAQTQIVPDGKISSGGCVLETALGVIDNQIESRLERIEQELCFTNS
jgi:flagellar assembly protein FliH